MKNIDQNTKNRSMGI